MKMINTEQKQVVSIAIKYNWEIRIQYKAYYYTTLFFIEYKLFYFLT